MIVVDAAHWLTEHGELPVDHPSLLRKALWMAQCIEYGGPLPKRHAVMTLIACRRRPGNQPCPGLLNVVKTEVDELLAYCPTCDTDELVIHNWQATMWADGPPLPIPIGVPPAPTAADPPHLFADRSADLAPTAADLPEDVRAELQRALRGLPFTVDDIVAFIAAANHPGEVAQRVLGHGGPEAGRDQLQALMHAIMNAWNQTPRAELGGRRPSEMAGPRREPVVAPPTIGRNEPCPCGSGKKFKRCCLQ